MYEIICTKVDDNYLLINRKSYKTFKITEKTYRTIISFASGSCFSGHLIELFKKKLGIKSNFDISKLIMFDDRKRNFYAASYEITNKCNFKCQHCYLGEKDNFELSLNEKKEIIYRIYESGCLWLQITGGEALLSKDFEETYLLAYSLGMLITISTNGSLIFKYQKLFKEYPPYKLAISLYGANPKTYKKITGISLYFSSILKNFECLKLNELRAGVNLIVLKDNQKELKKMKQLVEKYQLQYHIYDKISPALSGLNNPAEYSAQCFSRNKEKKERECYAGKKFFHVDARGKASICKIARKPNFDILSCKTSELFNNLRLNSKKLLQKSKECKKCLNIQCHTCTPLLKLHQKALYIPKYICQKEVSYYHGGKSRCI